MSKEFSPPEFIDNNNPEQIQERMMNALPDGIDDMPGGFAYDFTMPTAIEKSQLIQFHIVRTLMLMFPQYAWGEWLDLHASAAGVKRKPAGYASGYVTVRGSVGTDIPQGTVFCTASTDKTPSLEYVSEETVTIPDSESVDIPVIARTAGKQSNTKTGTVVFLLKGIKGVSVVTNPVDILGGTDQESDNDLFSRIEMENDTEGASFVGNDSDYIRWAKEVTGIGDCIVIPEWNGPGTVKLVLVDANGTPANDKLVQAVYNYIVSPGDREKRLLPTGCAELSVQAASTKLISFTCTGIIFDETTDIPQIIEDFKMFVAKEYSEAKKEGVLIYNQIRPILTDIPGVTDFDDFLINGSEENIILGKEEYAATDKVDFR